MLLDSKTMTTLVGGIYTDQALQVRDEGDKGYFSDGALVEKLKQGRSSLVDDAMMVYSEAGKGTQETSWQEWRNRRWALLFVQ